MGFVQGDHMVKHVAATALDPSLGHSVLPGTLNRGANRFYSQRSDCRCNFATKFRIAVEDQKSWSSVERKCLAQLLNDP